MLVNERVSVGSLRMFSFPHADFGPLPFPYDQPMNGLGKSFMKSVSAVHKKIYHATVPKGLRKQFKKIGGKLKKGFLKIAPILAIAAQILNFIPGLGIAVGLAITAGAAALTISAQAIQMQEGKKAMAKADKAANKESDTEVAASEKEANEKANEAYVVGEKYFTDKYGVNREAFESATLEEKLSFLQTAIEDRQKEEGGKQRTTTYLLVAGGILAVGAMIIIIAKKKQQKK
jgi:hypothetical protein